MSSTRSTLSSTYAARRHRRPAMSVARLLLLLCLGAHALGQTFQYSRGWTNGRKRAFAPPTAAEVNRDSSAQVLPLTDGEFLDEATAAKQGSVSEGRVVSMGTMDQGRLEALLVVLGNGKETGGEEELDMMKQKEVGGRRKGGWRRNSLSESFLRRRRRRVAAQQEASVATLN